MKCDDTVGCCGVLCAACPDYTQKNCRCRVAPEGQAPCNGVTCTGRHGVDYCGQCPEFPCADMKEFYEESPSHREAFVRMQALRRGEAQTGRA